MISNLNALLTMDPGSLVYKQTLAELLGRIKPDSPKGVELCNAMMRLWATPAFEAALFRFCPSDDEVETYLTQRAPDESAYPNYWYIPGSLYRSRERDEDVAARLGVNEFGCAIDFSLVDRVVHEDIRGTVHAHIFLVRPKGELRIDERHRWFKMRELPKPLVDLHEKTVIPRAFTAFMVANGRLVGNDQIE